MQSLEELLKGTDALTYLNALQITLKEIKSEVQEQDELREHLNNSCDRTKKLIRKADSHYRLIAKLVNGQPPVAHHVTVEEDIALDELKELMEE